MATTSKVAATKLLKLFGTKGQHWTKNSFARNKRNEATGITSSDADRWCLLGACVKLKILSTTNDSPMDNWVRAYTTKHDTVAFNDADGWASVRALLNRIKKYGARKKGLKPIDPATYAHR